MFNIGLIYCHSHTILSARAAQQLLNTFRFDIKILNKLFNKYYINTQHLLLATDKQPICFNIYEIICLMSGHQKKKIYGE